MEFKKKLKIRLYVSISYMIIGLLAMIFGFTMANDMLSALGLMFAVMGFARIRQYKRITKNEETLHQREIVETDERNVLIWNKARSLTFTIYIIVMAVAVLVFRGIGKANVSEILAWSMMAMVGIYWICYFIMSKKY